MQDTLPRDIAEFLTSWRDLRAVLVAAPLGFGKSALLRSVIADTVSAPFHCQVVDPANPWPVNGRADFWLLDDAQLAPPDWWHDLPAKLRSPAPGPCRIIAFTGAVPPYMAELLSAPDVLLLRGIDLLVDARLGQSLRSALDLPLDNQLLEWSGGWPMAYGVGLTLLRSGGASTELDSLGLQAVMEAYLDQRVRPSLTTAEEDGLAEITARWIDQGKRCATTLPRRVAMRLWQDLATYQGLVRLGPSQRGRSVAAELNPIFFEWFRTRFETPVLRHSRDLAVQAAERLFQQGKLILALEQLISAGLPERAGDLLDRAGGVRVGLRQGIEELERALSLLPPEVIDRRARLRLAQAYLISKQGQPQAARLLVQRVKLSLEKRPEQEVPTELRIETLYMDALLNLYEDRSEGIKDCDGLLELLAELSPEADFDQGVIYNMLTSFYNRRGQFDMARDAAEMALRRYQRISSTYLQIFMRVHLASIAISTGRLDDAQSDIKKARSLANRHHRTDRPFHAIINVVHAHLLCERGQAPDNAEALIEHSLPLIQRSEGWSDLYNRAYWVAVRLRAARGDLVGAFSILDQAEAFAEYRGLTQLTFFAGLARCDLLLKTLSYRAARRLFGAIDVGDRFRDLIEGEAFWQEWAAFSFIRAKLMMLEGRFGDALDALQDIDRQCVEREAVPQLVSVRLLTGMVRMALGQTDDWLPLVAQTAATAVSYGLWRSVTDQGFLAENLLRCARRALKSTTDASLTRQAETYDRAMRTLTDRCRTNQTGYFTPELAGLAKPMRCAVVALTLNGLTAKRIAKLLGVTEPAVKYHLKEAYRQYAVHSKHDLARLMPMTNYAK